MTTDRVAILKATPNVLTRFQIADRARAFRKRRATKINIICTRNRTKTIRLRIAESVDKEIGQRMQWEAKAVRTTYHPRKSRWSIAGQLSE